MPGRVYSYDDFEVGYAFPPHSYRIDAGDSDAFITTFDHTSVLDESGKAVRPLAPQSAVRPVHPTLVGSFQPQHGVFRWPTGVLHAREKVALQGAVYPGEQLEALISVKDKYLKNDKKFVVLEIAIQKLENRRTAMVIERTLLWPQ